jgi:hypothetical protein
MAVCSSPGSLLKVLYERISYYRSNSGTRPEIMDSNIVLYEVPLQKFIYSGTIERLRERRSTDAMMILGWSLNRLLGWRADSAISALLIGHI